MSKDIKKSAEFNLVEVIVIILITGIVVSVTSGLLVFKNYDKLFNVGSDTSSEFSEFKKEYDHIVNSYVKEVDREKLINAAITKNTTGNTFPIAPIRSAFCPYST